MNTPDFEHPALTAYALGELSPAEAATIRRMIATSPEVRAEYERIEQTVAALKKAPALPRRTLSPRQRETILAVGQIPAKPGKIVAFPQAATRRPNLLWTAGKAAIAASVTFGAFLLGQKMAAPTASGVVITTAAPQPASPTPEAAPARNLASTEATDPALEATPAPVRDAEPFEAVQQPPRVAPMLADLTPITPPAEVAPVVVDAAAPKAAPITPAPFAARPIGNGLKAFTLAAAAPESTIRLHPQFIRVAARPVPREFAGQILAAPIQEKPKSAAKPAPRKPEAQPPLVIHSWKAEVASCPWDASRRLMRFVAQIPVDQDGIETNARDYQISVKFDPAQVQAYRLITEKHMPPTNGSMLATRFAWYEIVPGRSFSPKADKPATLGSLDILQPRGAARDSQPLKLLDRGLSWSDAREDFVFETAMVGFNLLLQGTENVGSLNHKLVLDLAERSRDEDPKGERAKFVSVVKQAQRAAGL